jgi:hypothetical protein
MATVYSQVIGSPDTGNSDVSAGAGGTPSALVTSGASNTVSATTNTFIGWNSATTSAKAQTIPSAATTKDQIITVKDVYGTAATYNITVTPVSGTIDGQADFVISSNKAAYTFQADGTSNWMVV